MKRLSRQLGAVLLAMSLVAPPALAETIVTQGNGSTSVRPWRVQATGGGSGSTTSALNIYAPASTSTNLTANGAACTVAGGASCTTILASIELIEWSNVTITIRNSDAADTVENVLVQWSPDNSNWEVWDSTTFATLTAGQIRSLAISGNSRRYLRIQARASANSSTVVHLTMNDG